MKNVIIEDNASLHKYFEKNKKYQEELKDNILSNINTMIEEKPHKIKTVKGFKYKNKTIYEYKIVLNKDFVCRLSYIFEDDHILVFFISNTIRKMPYVKLVSHVKGVKKS